jgi:hypothetical protein
MQQISRAALHISEAHAGDIVTFGDDDGAYRYKVMGLSEDGALTLEEIYGKTVAIASLKDQKEMGMRILERATGAAGK